MASSFTTNKVLEKPGNGDYVDTWNVPVNGDLDIIDQAFGGRTALNATGGSATLSSSQYRSLVINVTGAISASVTYTIPSGIGGQWVVFNSTTDSVGGPHSIIIASAGGGTSYTVTRGQRTLVYSDGTNINVVNAAPTITVPTGGIIMWSGSIASIPSGWLICDGSSGTPDLRNRFVIGAGSTYAVAATGGSKDAIVVSHSHTATSTVTDPGHTHNFTARGDDGVGSPIGYGVVGYSTDVGSGTGNMASASTGVSVATSVASTGSSGTDANLPPYYALAYIMKS